MNKNILLSVHTQLLDAIFRFPIAVLCCISLSVINISALSCEMDNGEWIARLNMLLSLGFTLSVATSIIARDLARRKWQRYADVLILPLLVLYGLLMPEEHNKQSFIYYIIFYIVSIVLLGIAPLASTRQPMVLWQYNIRIWWKLLFASLYAAALCGGCMLALITVEYLFDIYCLHEKIHLYIVIFFVQIFCPLVFLCGIGNKTSVVAPIKYDVAPRIIGHYILLPLLCVYMFIMYAYGIKILVEWELPKGWLSWLIIIYLGAGFIVYFLQYNLYITRTSRIANIFGKGFFYSALPLIALLFLAIIRRVGDYGFTELRYYLMLAAVWVTSVSLYMIISKGKTFRPVLFSLAAVALLSLVGPWSAFNISDYSQRNRLEKILKKYDALHNGKFSSEQSIDMPYGTYDKLCDIVVYFAKKEHLDYIQPLFEQNFEELSKEYFTWGIPKHLFNNINKVDDENIVVETDKTEYYSIKCEIIDIPVSKYDRILSYSYYNLITNEDISNYVTADNGYKAITESVDIMSVYYGRELYRTINLKKIITEYLLSNNLKCYETLSSNDVSVAIDSNHKIIFTSIQGTIDNQSNDFSLISAELFLLIKY